MSLRTQIIIIFISIVVVTLSLSSLIIYHHAKETHLNEVYNHLNSLSEAKKLRMQGIIRKRQEQVKLLQIKEQMRENFALYLKNRDRKTLLELRNTLKHIVNRIPSFKEVQLVSMDGIVEVSSSYTNQKIDISDRVSYKHALRGEICMHDIYYDNQNKLALNISGVISYNGDDLGLIVIKSSADDILSLINDYTGLGKTGETTLARNYPHNKIYYIVPTRFFPALGDSLIEVKNSNQSMTQALAGNEDLLTSAMDYRNVKVIAAPRYISETGWGLNTKMDLEEAMAPVKSLLLRILVLLIVLIVVVTIIALLFADYIVNPIISLCNTSWQIANGNLNQKLDYHSNNEVGRLASSFNNMADRLLESNKAVSAKVEELDRINDSLNRFAYIVSHDLKSPLHSISGLVAFIKKKLENHDDEEIKMMLDLAEQKTQHTLFLISAILQYSMVGITEAPKEQVNLNQLVHDVIRNLEVPKHISIEVDPLPELYIERVLILQVFQNLISNAVKYMDKPIGLVKVSYTKAHNGYKFFVSDNGRGIEKRHFEKIFDIFNKTHRIEGIDSSGLGLSIVKKIIETKGGSVWVESEVGKGSTFYFILPV